MTDFSCTLCTVQQVKSNTFENITVHSNTVRIHCTRVKSSTIKYNQLQLITIKYSKVQ